jgi:hypothetical protein
MWHEASSALEQMGCSLHFPIKPGVVAAWNARTVVIVAPDGSSTRVRDVATGEERDVPVEELGGIPAIGQVNDSGQYNDSDGVGVPVQRLSESRRELGHGAVRTLVCVAPDIDGAKPEG